MNLNDIRKMNDKELKTFLSNMKNKNCCDKCGNVIDTKDKKIINIGTYDWSVGQKTRKLCSVCNECYINMLDYLGVSDIEWSE
jgi:hypothetical protein